jgi:signal transduction histidine kinase
LYNLLSNAIKFRSPARPCHIQLKTYLEGSYLILSIQDNGLGLSERKLKRLFTMFKRFHNHVEGTGIGLYITKRMIENTGGKIEVQSTEDQGTEFKVYFKGE